MFSTRLIWLFEFLDKFFKAMGVVSGTFNHKRQTFHFDPSRHWKVKRNYNLLVIWLLTALGIVGKYYRLGDVNRFNLCMAYWLAGVMTMVLYSIILWCPHEVCIMINGFIHFIHHMHGE